MEYDHKLISKSEVKDYCEDLETNFMGLYERFCNLGETKDETESENLAVEDATYYDGVAGKVYLIRDKKEKFDTSLRKYEEKAKVKQEALDALPDYVVALKIAKAEYEGCKGVIKEEVEKMDASEDREKAALLFPAESHKQDLASRYRKIMEAVGKMTRALELSGENETSIIDKTGFKYNDEAKLVSELNHGLDTKESLREGKFASESSWHRH